MSYRSLLAVLALSFALSGCDRAGDDAAQQQQSLQGEKAALSGVIDHSFAGTLMPNVNVVDPDGRSLNLGALQGRPVLVNLWATWCAPCVIEMPMLDSLADELGDSVRVLTVSQDLQGAEKVGPFFEERNFRNLEPWMDTKNQLGFGFGGGSMPMTVLYDASGQEVFRVMGAYEWNSPEAIAEVEMALGWQTRRFSAGELDFGEQE